jgi:hypothetical protein
MWERQERTCSPVAASPGVSAARPGSIPRSDLGVSPGIYSRLRSSVGLRQSPEGRVVRMVARSSMRTGCALCACGGVSVCLCVCSDTTTVPQKSRLKKKDVGAAPLQRF